MGVGEWLQDGTSAEGQSEALRYALRHLSGLEFTSDQEWVTWYHDGPGKTEFPEPDLDSWYADLKAIHGES